jgi:UV DNA damage endonuclease
MLKRLGFACVMSTRPLSTNHTFRLASLSYEKLQQTMQRNLKDLELILSWMDEHDLRLFRIGSSFVPFASHQDMTYSWEDELAGPLEEIGQRYESKGFRFSLHPGQYNLLNSEKSEVIQKTIVELDYSCRVLELMKLDTAHKVIIHGGCFCGDKSNSLQRLVQTIEDLPQRIRSRLVLENDERLFSFADIMSVCEKTNVPPVFDIFHHKLNPCKDIQDLLQKARSLWDSRPKVHISSQKSGARAGKHADYILQQDLEELCTLLPWEADLMVEAKAKEAAALEVLQQATILGCRA